MFVPYDQLSDAIGPLAESPVEELGIVLVESAAKGRQRPYHRQKLALILTNLRHFALEQAARGVAVRHVATEQSFAAALRPLADQLGPLTMMAAAERELAKELEPLVADGVVEVVEHGGWLTTTDQFLRGAGSEPPWRMNAFYRLVRQETAILMDDGAPVGGKYSFDTENRKPWKGQPPAPQPPTFDPDDITLEVADLIERRFERHPGSLRLESLPADQKDAESLWSWALEHCLEHFGPYEDAMSVRSRSLFHTRVSQLVNLHRLLPGDLVRDVAAADAPLESREGFIRQILGWREFIRHVHSETDGFRTLTDSPANEAEEPGDGGWQVWTGESWHSEQSSQEAAVGGARPSHLGVEAPIPAAYWGRPSGLACLDRVVHEVWDEGYTHHIPRLMVLSNLATLLDVSPRQLTDWFWVAFVDAFDWVVEPNVLGMGTFALGDLFTTKPYVSGANYIRKMSDYCEDCRFDPKKNCPITRLYWAFLERHRKHFEDNPRMRLVLRNLDRRPEQERDLDRETFETTRQQLEDGSELAPLE